MGFNNKNTIAYELISNRWTPYWLAPLLWVLCWETQTFLSKFVGMATENGFFILYLSLGAVFISLLVFGRRVLISLTLGYGLYFWLQPEQAAVGYGGVMFIENIAETFFAYLFIESVRRARGLNELYDHITMRQIIFMLVAIAFFATTLRFFIPSGNDLEPFSVLLFELLGSIVGVVVVFYAFIQGFGILAKLRWS